MNDAKHGMAELLSSIGASGDNWLKLITIVLIALTGGGNFLATKSASQFNASEIERATGEVHDIHLVLNSSLERQKRLEQMLTEIRTKLDQK